jgi:SAM-dependent methyltransferase
MRNDSSLELSESYWNEAAETYPQAFTGTLVGKMWRDTVWRGLDAAFAPGLRVLELNCGTGIDAFHLAQRGVSVSACDISSRMIEMARKSAIATDGSDLIDFRVLPTEQLSDLKGEAIFDGAFSNFSGLNCVRDLAEVRRNLARLVKPGSAVFLCMLGRYALWEKLRRLVRATGVNAAPSGVEVQRPSRKCLEKLFAPEFRLRDWKGIGIAVPPAYMEHWAVRFPKLIRGLDRVDRMISGLPGLRSLGACILFEFERTTYAAGE